MSNLRSDQQHDEDVNTRIDTLHDVLNDVANRVEELEDCRLPQLDRAFLPEEPQTPETRSRTEHFTLSPEVMSCSPPKRTNIAGEICRDIDSLPGLPAWPIPKEGVHLGIFRPPPPKCSSAAGPLPPGVARVTVESMPSQALPKPEVGSAVTSHWSQVGSSELGADCHMPPKSGGVGDLGQNPGQLPTHSESSFETQTAQPGLQVPVSEMAHVSMAASEGLGDYKYLKQSPSLCLTGDRTWEKCMALDLWFQQMSITASAVGKGMENHWRAVLSRAREAYQRNQSLSIADRVIANSEDSLGLSTIHPGSEQLEGKLLVALMAALPVEIKRPLLEARPNRAPTSIELVHQALEWCAPGGKEDKRSLLEFVRRPGGAFVSAADCRARIRLWRTAKHRLTRLGLSQPPPTEMLMALEEIVASLERKHETLRFALQSARLASEVRQPTERGIQVFEQTVEQELIMLEQDERTRVSGASVNVVREVPPRKPCHFFNKPGGCNRNPCPYAHVAKEDAKSQKPEKPNKPEPKLPNNPKAKESPKKRGDGKGDKGKSESKAKSKAKPRAKAAAADSTPPPASVEIIASMLRVCSELEAVLKSVDAHVGKEPLPWVLVDSGANQVLRPWSPEVEKELGQAAPLDVTLASGERRRGWKTTQGEVVLPKMFASSSPWILPVSRVVRELGYQVIWKPEAVELQSPSGRVFTCVMKHDLPYLRWKDFKDIRRQLAKSFQESSRRSYASQVSAEPNAEADEENLELTKADEIDASEDTEVWTSKMLCLEAELVAAAAKVRDIQASALEAVSKAYLAEVPEIPAADLSHVLETLVGQFPFVDRCCPRAAHRIDEGRTNSIVLGHYQHGMFSGLTSWSSRIPCTVRLLNTILLKQLPAESEWTSIQLSKNAHAAPHRDSRNQGPSFLRAFGDFQGGRLWVEDQLGLTSVARDGKDISGTLYDTRGHWLKLNAKHLMHSVEKFVGTRISMSVYVAGTGKFVTAEMVQALVDLGFKLPLSHKRAGFSPATVSKETPVIVQPVVVSAFGRMSVSHKQDEHADMHECLDGVHETVHEACVCFGPLLPDVDRRDNHARCGHVPSRADCEACQEALGLRRRHKKIPVDARSTAVLSLDLTGPHPRAFETEAQYALIAVATFEQGLNLVYGVPIVDKTSAMTLQATRHVLSVLRSLFGGKLPIAQVHSDCGGEFLSNMFRQTMSELGLLQTTSQPGDKEQNGRAERYVGLVKSKTIALLQEGRLPVTMWAHVLPHACFLLRQSALGRAVPSKLPAPGDCVIVPSKEQAVREGGDFMAKVRYGVFIGVDESILEGAVVAVREGQASSLVRVSGPKKWKSAGLKRWRMHNHPTQPKKVVWVSSVGDVVWTAPHTSTMLSFEERRPSQGRHDVDEYVRRGIHGYTAQQHYSLYMHSYETPDEVDDDSNHPGVECSWLQVAAHHANLVREARPSPDVWVKVGHVLIRRHFTPRVGMYEPVEDEVCKQPGTNLSADRVTIMLTEGGGKSVIIDRWTDGKPGRALLPDKRTWRGVTLFGILNPSNSDEVPEGAATVAAARTGQITEHVAHRYWLPEPAAETEMHRMEAVAENLETDELVNVSVDPREVEQATEPERSRWMEGIQGELSNLEGMEVFERITREEYESRKVRDPRLARPLPAKLVLVKKPNPESPDPENPYKHKARIVICGNMQPGAQKDLSNRAEVPDAFFTRCVFALTMILSFSLSVLDVNAAFLYAELPETEPTVVVAPPGILKRLGYAGKTELWRLRRALYGLRVSPKCWTKTRNNTIRGVEVELPGGETAVFHPADAQEHVWVLVGTQGGIVGYLLFYVDDILLAAALRNVFAIRTKVSEIWKVKDQGILANPADKSVKDEVERSHNAQKELGFLGMRIGFSGDGDLECHQIPYVKSCLKERGFSDLRGSQSLPNIQEGMEPEFDDRNCDEYRGLLRKGQQEIGSLLWASQRTRPDIAAVIGVLGSMLVTHPRKVVEWKWSHQVWRYLAATLEHKVVFDRRPNQATQMLELSVSADASFAAGGDKSRRGVVAMLNGYLVQWSSIRQSLAAQSAVETEIQAAGLGCTRAVAILNLVKGLIEGTLTVELLSDNTGCIANIMHTVTTWRNRHFCVRAAALRDQLTEHEIVLRYRSGKLILADALTKVLGRQALELARAALGIRLSANAS